MMKFQELVCCLHKYLNKILFLQEPSNTHFLLISEQCNVLSETGILFSIIQHVCGEEEKGIIMCILLMRNHAVSEG